MSLSRWPLALVAAAVLVVGLLVPAAPARGEQAGLRITQVNAVCECGGVFMPWGWGETHVRFVDPTRVKGHTYQLVVSPKRPVAAQMRRGYFWFLQGDARFRLGTTYTFRVKEYDGSRRVETSPPYRWTPQRVGAPSELGIDTTTMSNGIDALIAGTTYTLHWTGAWETGARVHADVLTLSSSEQILGRIGGRGDAGPVPDPDDISFTPTQDDVGTWVNIRVYGSKPGRVDDGFGGDDELTYPVVANADDVAHAQRIIPATALGDIRSTGKTRVGSTVTVKPKIPKSSGYLGLTVTYHWYTADQRGVELNIKGATHASYTVRRADRWKSLLVRVTYHPSNPDYAPYAQGYYIGEVKG